MVHDFVEEDNISRWLKMLSQRIFNTLALEALWPGAFDMRLIMVDGHDLSIVCYTYVEYNKSSRERAHNQIREQYFSIYIYNYI